MTIYLLDIFRKEEKQYIVDFANNIVIWTKLNDKKDRLFF